MAQDSAPGAAIYSSLVLLIYDFWVLFISNLYAWRCPTGTILVPFFNKNISKKHLDVGVGTGYYLAHAPLTASHSITLLDLNRNSLDAANRRIGGKAKTLLHDALEPLPIEEGERFDSVSLCYLLHCMPGPPERKVKLFANLRGVLSEKGVLFGTTVLGQGVEHNAFGRYLMSLYNKKGLFGNELDSRKVFEDALRENFEEVDCRIEGVVLLFEARRPRVEKTKRARL
ncbi:uncharacterized protein PAC_19077 [Phialocephala subalpina]|uniref:Methyltransferase type 11 domain-containing protein n=1 Tax=Phialocephala subalpina TaxID=576137 RepID=A0A1L7XVY5_9HELO|nr:uncharacterized protein PAC_19077 [Phialocephala subalpina]